MHLQSRSLGHWWAVIRYRYDVPCALVSRNVVNSCYVV